MMRYRFGLVLLLAIPASAPVWAGGDTPAPLKLQGVGRGHTARIYRGVFTKDSKTFLSVGIDAVVRAWNVADGAPLYTLAGHTGSIHGVGLAGDRLLVTGAENGDLFLWDLVQRKKVGKLGKTNRPLHCLAVSHDAKILATGGGEWNAATPGELRLWDLESREEIALLAGHRRLVLGVAFSPDDQLLAAVDYSGDLHVWNLVTRKPVVTLFQENPAGAVAFSPDGKFLVVGDYQGRLNVWDTTHWLDEGVVRGHPGGVMWLRYSAKGNMLASAGWDGSIKLWNGYDVEATPPVRVTDHPNKAWMVAFSPDGKTLASAGEDRLVKFWTIGPEFAKRYVPAAAKPTTAPERVRTGEARIALVTAYPLDAARTLQDLSIANLSNEKGIVLLQRDAVDKILAEQKLSQSGLVQAQSAVQLGKILAVDLVGVIDVSLEAKEPLGFVLFDAATGVRLHDDGFAKDKTEQQLRAIAKGVRSGVQKWRAGTKQLKTVCVLPARNADLRRGMDAFCEALGAALERQLVHHPGITMLERKWLDSVNQEKTITSAAVSRELLASVLIVDLEIARAAQGKGVRGTITVRDNAGKVLHKLDHQVADDQGADLLGPLTKRLHDVLNTAQSDTLVKPSREARRFARETQMLSKHGHLRQALQAAEAAYALVPDDEARLRLAECLLNYPREMWRKKVDPPDRNKYPPVERTAEEVRAGLSMVRRGQQLVDSAKSRVQEMPDHPVAYWFSLAESPECAHADTATWQALQVIKITPADPSIAEELVEFRNTAIRRHMDRIREMAAMKRWAPKYRLQRMTPGLRSHYVYAFDVLAPDSATHQKALRDAIQIWLDVSYQIPTEEFPVETAAHFAESPLTALARSATTQRSDADAQAAELILKALRDHPHPVLRLYGSHFQMKYDLALKRITPQEAEKRFRANISEGKRWIDEAPFKNPDPHRVAFYEFLKVMLWDAQRDFDTKAIDEAYAGIVDYMLEHKDIAGWATVYLLGHKLIVSGKLTSGLQVIYRFQEMYAGPKHRLFYDPNKDVLRSLKRDETTILQIDPKLAKQKLEAPWDHVICLAEAHKLTNTSYFFTPVRHEDRVYFLAGVFDSPPKTQTYLQLQRVALEGGGVQSLGKLPFTPHGYDGKSPPYWAFSYDTCVVQSLIHGKQFIVATPHDGIYLFPLEGGAPVHIGAKEGLPSQEVVCLTALDNQVVASLAGGYLVQIDLATRRVEVLASSRRTNKLSPFDNDRPFYMRTLLADPERSRILFTAGLYGTFSHPNAGTWEYSLKTRNFKKHLPFTGFHFSRIQDGAVYMEQQFQNEWLGRFDLAKNQFTLLRGKTPPGIDKQQPEGLPQKFTAKFHQRLYLDDFLWEPGPFQRRTLKSDKEEPLPHPARGYTLQVWVRECLEPIGPRELLIGDWRGLYVVRLKK